jgi:hypothetical protein
MLFANKATTFVNQIAWLGTQHLRTTKTLTLNVFALRFIQSYSPIIKSNTARFFFLNFICKHKKQQTSPDKLLGNPKSSSLARGGQQEFHLHTIRFEPWIFFEVPAWSQNGLHQQAITPEMEHT